MTMMMMMIELATSAVAIGDEQKVDDYRNEE